MFGLLKSWNHLKRCFKCCDSERVRSRMESIAPTLQQDFNKTQWFTAVFQLHDSICCTFVLKLLRLHLGDQMVSKSERKEKKGNKLVTANMASLTKLQNRAALSANFKLLLCLLKMKQENDQIIISDHGQRLTSLLGQMNQVKNCM